MKLIKNILKKDFARNTIITFLLMTVATIISFVLFYTPNFSPSVIAPIYILVLILIGTYTTGYLPGIIASVISVICINFLFTYPYFQLNFTITGYPLTFIVMLSISLIISTYMTRFKKQGIALAEKEKLIAEGEKEKMRANLLRSISHDLRTPLTSIIGASSSLNNVLTCRKRNVLILCVTLLRMRHGCLIWLKIFCLLQRFRTTTELSRKVLSL